MQEKFPNLGNRKESPNKLIESLRKKINIAILYGGISLTALVAVGCGSKTEQAGADEGASRFPKAEEVIKNEKENKPKGLEALSPVKYQDHMLRLREAESWRTNGGSSAYSDVQKKARDSFNQNQNSNSLSETEKKPETGKPKPFISNPDDF